MTFQQYYAHAAVSDFHGALVDACVQADRTIAPQAENSHGRSCGAGAHVLQLQETALHHASPGMLGLASWAVASQSRASLLTQSQIEINVTVYLYLCKGFLLPAAARGIGSTGQSLIPSGLKAGIPWRISDG